MQEGRTTLSNRINWEQHIILYNFVRNYQAEHQRFPTYRAIVAANIGYKSTSHVDSSLKMLEELGLIEKDGRYYKIVGARVTMEMPLDGIDN